MSDAEMWQRLGSGDEAARDQLMASHLSLVHHIARGIHRRMGGSVELDELVSAGTLGLAEALDRFEPERGLAFSTFAVPRIHGAIIDELRRLDTVPPGVRRRARKLNGAEAALSQTLGRRPQSRETAVQLGVDVETVVAWQVEAAGAARVGLDDGVAGEDGEHRTLAETLAAADDGADVRLNREQELRLLRAALVALPDVERRVITLYFLEELKLQDIARVLEVTASRVSQIKQKALDRLRAALEPASARVA